MTGKELRNILFTNGIQHKMLYDALRVSQQSFSQMLNSDNVKSGLLEDIAKALGKDMTFFYPVAPSYEQTSNNFKEVHARNIGAVGSGNGTVNDGSNTDLVNKLLGELSELRKANQKLMESNQKLMDKLLG